MQVNIAKSEIPKSSMRAAEETECRVWCSDITQLNLLKQVNVKYMYYDQLGLLIDETNHRIENCPR